MLLVSCFVVHGWSSPSSYQPLLRLSFGSRGDDHTSEALDNVNVTNNQTRLAVVEAMHGASLGQALTTKGGTAEAKLRSSRGAERVGALTERHVRKLGTPQHDQALLACTNQATLSAGALSASTISDAAPAQPYHQHNTIVIQSDTVPMYVCVV